MNIRELKREQVKLAKKIIIKDEFDEINHIAGCDQVFFNDKIISAVVVLNLNNLEVVEKKYAILDCKMQYIPGFLAYRESPAVVEAFNRLKQRPDILFVDGNGILHQRKLGLASHIGIALDIPTIGVAKKQIMGDIINKKIILDDEVRGEIVETKDHAKPVIVSPGNKISLRSAVSWTKKCLIKHKLPEPLHEAHKYANKIRKRLAEDTTNINNY